MKEKDLLEDPAIEVRITSEWIFKKKYLRRALAVLVWLGLGTGMWLF
jgi:hypothetical protein